MAFLSLSDDTQTKQHIYNPLGFFESPTPSECSEDHSFGETSPVAFRPERRARRKPSIRNSSEHQDSEKESSMPEPELTVCAFHAYLENETLKISTNSDRLLSRSPQSDSLDGEVSPLVQLNSEMAQPHEESEDEVFSYENKEVDTLGLEAHGQIEDEQRFHGGVDEYNSSKEQGPREEEGRFKVKDMNKEFDQSRTDIVADIGNPYVDDSNVDGGTLDDIQGLEEKVRENDADEANQHQSAPNIFVDEDEPSNDGDDSVFAYDEGAKNAEGNEMFDQDEGEQGSFDQSDQDEVKGANSVSSAEMDEDSLEEVDMLHQPRSFIFETRIEAAHALRLLGNSYFKADQVQLALECYDRGLYHVSFEDTQLFELSTVHLAVVNAERLPLHLNKGLCLAKIANGASEEAVSSLMMKAMQEADNTLALQSNHPKALMLKGKSLVNMGRAAEGLVVLHQALEAAPSTEYKTIEKLIKAAQVLAKREPQSKHTDPKNMDSKTPRFRHLPLLFCFLVAFVLAWRGRVGSVPPLALEVAPQVVPQQPVPAMVAKRGPRKWLDMLLKRLQAPKVAQQPQRNGLISWLNRIGNRFKNPPAATNTRNRWNVFKRRV